VQLELKAQDASTWLFPIAKGAQLALNLDAENLAILVATFLCKSFL
jgi:hypothetical protein